MFGAAVPLYIKTLSERILLAASPDTGLPLLLAKKYLSSQLELNFLFSYDFSFDTQFLLNCYTWLNIASLMHIF